MASRGYPGAADTGKIISGLDDVSSTVFHAATRDTGEGLVTSGGRVLAVVAHGENVEQARKRAYDDVARIHFEGAHHRQDIGAR